MKNLFPKLHLPFTGMQNIILTLSANREGICLVSDPGLICDPAQASITLSGDQKLDKVIPLILNSLPILHT